MGNWVLLSNEDELKEKIKLLKRENHGCFYTNYQSFNSTLDNELDYTETFYMQGENSIFVIKRIDDYYKLYYAWGRANLEQFPRSVTNGITVFDIFEIDGKEKQTEAVCHLQNVGFYAYKKYHMWECSGIDFKIPSFRSWEIVDEKDLNRLSNIYSIFDPYSDMLPPRRMFKDYMKSRYAFSIFKKGQYGGSQIYSVNGNVVEGEFVYAIDKGSGAGGILLMKTIERCFFMHGCKKLNAWIDDDNNESIETHKSAGFIKTNQSKTTYIKGI